MVHVPSFCIYNLFQRPGSKYKSGLYLRLASISAREWHGKINCLCPDPIPMNIFPSPSHSYRLFPHPHPVPILLSPSHSTEILLSHCPSPQCMLPSYSVGKMMPYGSTVQYDWTAGKTEAITVTCCSCENRLHGVHCSVYYAPASMGALYSDGCCLTVHPSVCLSVCPVPDSKSRTEGRSKLKIGRMDAHDMDDLWPHLEVKGSIPWKLPLLTTVLLCCPLSYHSLIAAVGVLFLCVTGWT